MSKAFYTVPKGRLQLDQHSCELAVIQCIDFRFRQSDQEAIEKGLDIKNFDLIRIPAPAKSLIENEQLSPEIVSIITNVCCGLHKVEKILVLGHWDCGGYGGSSSFSSAKDEEEKYVADLKKAQAVLLETFPRQEIIIGYSRENQEGGLDYFLIT